TFERKRILQTSQNGLLPQPLSFTRAVSRNDAPNGARTAPKKMKMVRSRSLSNRTRPSTRCETHKAPIKAWSELLTNQETTTPGGTPLCNSDARCAGNAASKISHHQRLGVRSNAARRIEFGIQRTDTEPGCRAKAKPILEVK